MRLNLLRRPKPEPSITDPDWDGSLVSGQHRVQAVIDAAPHGGLQNAVLGDSFTLPPKIPVFGKYIHGRVAQMIAWSAIVGALGVGLPAGWYYLLMQTDWYVHLGPIYFHIFFLKNWWDGTGVWQARGGMGFIRSKSWSLYRHLAFRDQLEPAIFGMAIVTLLAKPKTWKTRVGLPRLIASPFILVALAIGMGLAGTWLIYFGLPNAWYGMGLHHLNTGFISKLSLPTLLLAFVMGKVLHRVWGPVGATLQGLQIDRSVDTAKLADHIPLWVRYPVVPPVIRERFSWVWEHDATVTQRKKLGKWARFALTAFIVLSFLVMIVGLIAKYWIAKGHHFPYLAP